MTRHTPQLPTTFETKAYREAWVDLRDMDDDALRRHYWSTGISEGRRANQLQTRQDFAALVSKELPALEIGPFFRPLIKGRNVRYFDVLDTEALRTRAAMLNVDPSTVPNIDFVSSNADLSIVKKKFSNVLSSHCIEHQPNLIGHFHDVSRLLEPEGRYFLLIPDRRYCFDHFQHDTTIADAIDDYRRGRTRHSLRRVLEHRAMTTHNDPVRHWCGDHGTLAIDQSQRLLAALAEFDAAGMGYIDVHNSYFTPQSFVELIHQLSNVALTDFALEEIYPTRYGSDEFWAVLVKVGF